MSSNINKIFAQTEAHIRGIVDQVHEAAETAVDEGAMVMQEMIATRGTQEEWRGTYFKNGIPRKASKPGRVWTGDMVEAVKKDSSRSGGDGVYSFGWLDRQEEYYLLQEEGFEHSEAGRWVEGMYALQDSREFVIDEFESALRRIK